MTICAEKCSPRRNCGVFHLFHSWCRTQSTRIVLQLHLDLNKASSRFDDKEITLISNHINVGPPFGINLGHSRNAKRQHKDTHENHVKESQYNNHVAYSRVVLVRYLPCRPQITSKVCNTSNGDQHGLLVVLIFLIMAEIIVLLPTTVVLTTSFGL